MSKEATKPTHRLIRYYGTGRNASRAEIGAIWTREDGSLSIRLDMLDQQIWLSAFEIKEDNAPQDSQ